MKKKLLKNVAVVYPEVLDMARYRSKRKEFPPFGALYIAASMEQKGHTIKIFKLNPFNLTFDFTDFDAVAFSISASATFNMFLECRTTSKFGKNTILMAGGIHANLFPEQTLLDLKVDVVGVGEGEETINELLACENKKEFSGVPGVCLLKNGIPFKTPPRKLSRNIDGFPFPARHLLPVDDFIMDDRMSNQIMKMTHIMPGRGCPFPCRFCASAQTRVQFRSGRNIREELIELVDNYGIKGFAVVGNDFILNKDNVYDISNSIKDLNLSWATLSRVDRVDKELLAAMKQAGCYELEFGVEAGSQTILDAMRKKTTVDQIRNGLRLSFEAGIKNKVFLIHGFPGENMKTTMETLELLDEVAPYIERASLFRFVPLPGTYVYNNAKEFGIRGTYNSKEWDGNWGKFHIHHNQEHWWGSLGDWDELNKSFDILYKFVESKWPSRFKLEELPKDKWKEQSLKYSKKTSRLNVR